MPKPKCLCVTGLTRKKYMKLLQKCIDENWEDTGFVNSGTGPYTLVAARRWGDAYRIMERENKRMYKRDK